VGEKHLSTTDDYCAEEPEGPQEDHEEEDDSGTEYEDM
jgi:hypothetical protein